MIKVWILFMLLNEDSRFNANGPAIIDNIASKSECMRIGAYLNSADNFRFAKYNCVEVWKIK